jgi:hypothetical protein
VLDHGHVGEPHPPRFQRLGQALLLVRLQTAGLVEELHGAGAVGEHRRQCPRPYRTDRRATRRRRLEGEAQCGGAVLGVAVLTHDDLPAGGLPGGIVPGAHEHDRPYGLGDDLLPDGTEQEADDRPVAA